VGRNGKANERIEEIPDRNGYLSAIRRNGELYNAHNIAGYTNIKMGRDTKFFLPPFFKIKSLPFQALYDKKGELITTFEGNVEVTKVLKAFARKD